MTVSAELDRRFVEARPRRSAKDAATATEAPARMESATSEVLIILDIFFSFISVSHGTRCPTCRRRKGSRARAKKKRCDSRKVEPESHPLCLRKQERAES